MASEPNWRQGMPAGAEQFPNDRARWRPLPWSGWDVTRIAAFAIAMILVFVIAFTIGAQKLFYPKLSFVDVAKFPLLNVLAQLAAYFAVLAYMYVVATHTGERFGQAVRWNWPQQPILYVIAGILISIGLQLFANFLPMPKSLPIDQFFQTPLEAWVLSLFGMTFAPLVEELFFRGFLYPVLARRLGEVVGVLLTALAFSLIHAPQLARAWGPVLIIFLIGLVLTVVRAVTKSVAPGLLIHMAYNGTISALLFFHTGGFRHLEKITQ